MMTLRIVRGRIRIRFFELSDEEIAERQEKLMTEIGSINHVGGPNELSCALSVHNLRKLKRLGARLENDPHSREVVASLREKLDHYEAESKSGVLAKKGELAIPYEFKMKPFAHQVIGFNFLHSMQTPALFGDCGVGKGLSLDTPILTPSGWVPMEMIDRGSIVVARDGGEYPVTDVYPQGVQDVFQIGLEDGATVIADNNHLWPLHESHGQVVTTTELARLVMSGRTVFLPPVSQRVLRFVESFPKDVCCNPRRVVSVSPYGRQRTQCISVFSPDNTYICGDLVVTHNTFMALTFADSLVKQEKKVAFIVVCPVNLINHVWKEDAAKFSDLSVVGLREPTTVQVRAADFDDSKDPDDKNERARLRAERKKDPAWRKKARRRAQKRHRAMLEERFAKDADVYVINPENLRTDVKERRLLSLCRRKVKEGFELCLIIDESSRVKTRTSRTYKALKRIRAYCSRCIIMTGTPSPNGLLDLWAQFSILDDGMTLQPSFTDYRHETCREQTLRYVTWTDASGHKHNATKWVPKPGAAKKVYRQIEPRVIRFRTEECIDLPPRRFITRHVDMSAEQAEVYNEMQDRLFFEIEDETVTAPVAMTKLLKLREITGGFVISDNGDAIPLGSNAPKMLELDRLLEQSIGDKLGDDSFPSKALVWAQYRWECTSLVKRYEKKYGARGLFGGISSTKKDHAIREFKRNPSCRLLVCHPASVGHGLTLTEANYAFYYSLSYNFEEFYQSFRRMTRPGQKRSMTYYFLVCPGTIDEELLSAIKNKKNLSDIVTDGELSREAFIDRREEQQQSSFEWDISDD